MLLKNTGDSKDHLVWHCRKLHKVQKDDCIYTVKHVKLSVRHNSWLVGCKISLEFVLELIYLWAHTSAALKLCTSFANHVSVL